MSVSLSFVSGDSWRELLMIDVAHSLESLSRIGGGFPWNRTTKRGGFGLGWFFVMFVVLLGGLVGFLLAAWRYVCLGFLAWMAGFRVGFMVVLGVFF
jgi:hypothetical protein